MKLHRLAALFVAATLAEPAPARAADSLDSAAMRRAISATVRILTGSLDPQGRFRGQTSGSGVIVSARGEVLTNHHVVFPEGSASPYPQIWVGMVQERLGLSPPSRANRLKLLAADAALDLALLEIVPKEGEKSGPYPSIPLGSTADLFYGSRLWLAGFPAAGGPTTTVVSATVLGIDEEAGWVKVDGAMMHGVSGGAALDERGALLGVPTQVRADQEVPFLGDSDVPVGTIVFGTVGYVRSAEAVRSFLGRTKEGPLSDPERVRVTGVVRDTDSNTSLPNSVIGLLRPTASPEAGEITAPDLLAFARSDGSGMFTLNRACRPGKYVMKVVHPGYRTLVRPISVGAKNADFEVTLKKESP